MIQSVAEQLEGPIRTNGFDRADQGGCYGGVFGKEDLVRLDPRNALRQSQKVGSLVEE